MGMATLEKLKARIALEQERWGPGLDCDDGPICIPEGTWQQEVAGWPHPRWKRWRDRSAEILAGDPRGARSVEAIREANHGAYVEIIDAETPRMPQERPEGRRG